MSKDKNKQAADSEVVNAKDFIEMQGEVLELMPAATFKVALERFRKFITAAIAGAERPCAGLAIWPLGR